MPVKREITVYDYNGHAHIRFLVDFLGKEAIDRRLQQVDRELNTERGIYRDYWVRPRLSFWLGLREARAQIATTRSLQGLVTPVMNRPLQMAAQLALFKRNMPPATLDEYRSRILGSDDLAPVYYELDTAGHFWQLGYNIVWSGRSTVAGEKSPEFIAKSRTHELEVECKSQSTDVGRGILRPRFYRLADALFGALPLEEITGKILITVPGRMPSTASWQVELVRAVNSAFEARTSLVELTDGTRVIVDLHTATGMQVPPRDFDQQVQSLRTPFSHIAVRASSVGAYVISPVILRVSSQTDDRVLDSILQDLRTANHQFSGTRAGIITCLVPEIESFEGLQQNSALVAMTAHFFSKHAGNSVYAVSYSSSPQETISGPVLTSSSPAIFFRSAKYDHKFGEDFPLSA